MLDDNETAVYTGDFEAEINVDCSDTGIYYQPSEIAVNNRYEVYDGRLDSYINSTFNQSMPMSAYIDIPDI